MRSTLRGVMSVPLHLQSGLAGTANLEKGTDRGEGKSILFISCLFLPTMSAESFIEEK
jgi:hypothetical protein